jgi:hypothetical protein
VTTQSLNFLRRLKEISMFFDGRDQVHKSLRRLVRHLKKAGIPYVIMGGMAVNAHKYERTTNDVDVLLTPAGLAEFRRLFVPHHYQNVPGRARRFVDQLNHKSVDISVTGRYPSSGHAGPIPFPDPEAVHGTINHIQFVELVTLVQLKLAARRHRDFGDVVELIRFNNLDESFTAKLHRSVRRDYIECLEEKHREDEYEEREG